MGGIRAHRAFQHALQFRIDSVVARISSRSNLSRRAKEAWPSRECRASGTTVRCMISLLYRTGRTQEAESQRKAKPAINGVRQAGTFGKTEQFSRRDSEGND